MFMDLIKIELKGLPQRLFLSGLYDDIDGFRVVLKEKIKLDPRDVPEAPPYPDKSFGTNKKSRG